MHNESCLPHEHTAAWHGALHFLSSGFTLCGISHTCNGPVSKVTLVLRSPHFVQVLAQAAQTSQAVALYRLLEAPSLCVFVGEGLGI